MSDKYLVQVISNIQVATNVEVDATDLDDAARCACRIARDQLEATNQSAQVDDILDTTLVSAVVGAVEPDGTTGHDCVVKLNLSLEDIL